MSERHCIHVDLFGMCGNRKCGYHGPCSGVADDVPEEEDMRTGDAIPDGNCCVYFEDAGGVK